MGWGFLTYIESENLIDFTHSVHIQALFSAYIGSSGTDVIASPSSMEEPGEPGENHRQQWVETKTPQPGSNPGQRVDSPGRFYNDNICSRLVQ